MKRGESHPNRKMYEKRERHENICRLRIPLLKEFSDIIILKFFSVFDHGGLYQDKGIIIIF